MLARFARLDYGLRGSPHESLDRKRPPSRLALPVFLFLLLVVLVLHARVVGDQPESFHSFTPIPTSL
jgi:hypothetical protein